MCVRMYVCVCVCVCVCDERLLSYVLYYHNCERGQDLDSTSHWPHGLNMCIKGSEVTPIYTVATRMTGDQIVVNDQDMDFKQLIDGQSTPKLSIKMLHKLGKLDSNQPY